MIEDHVRMQYSALVNSPKHSQLPSVVSEIEFGGMDDREIKKLSAKYLSQEEKDVVREIEVKARRELSEALNMYNRFHGNHLFEPKDKVTGKSDYAIRVKSIIPEKYLNYAVSPTSYGPNSAAKREDFISLPSSNLESGGMSFKNMTLLNEKFLREIGSSGLHQRRRPELGTLETNYDTEEAMLTIDDEGNVKKMNDMREQLKTERFLTKEEKQFLKLVKENGTKLDVQFYLNNQKDLINLKDNVRRIVKEMGCHNFLFRENKRLYIGQ